MILASWVPLVLLIGLTVWYGLAFIGVPGLVGAWRISDGVWFLMALAVAAGLASAVYAYARRRAWGDWLLVFLLPGWFYTQYASHWHRFFFPPSPEVVQRYYANFPYWYLLPQPTTRIVPDGFHTIMHALIAALFVIALIGVIRQLRGSAAKPNNRLQRATHFAARR